MRRNACSTFQAKRFSYQHTRPYWRPDFVGQLPSSDLRSHPWRALNYDKHIHNLLAFVKLPFARRFCPLSLAAAGLTPTALPAFCRGAWPLATPPSGPWPACSHINAYRTEHTHAASATAAATAAGLGPPTSAGGETLSANPPPHLPDPNLRKPGPGVSSSFNPAVRPVHAPQLPLCRRSAVHMDELGAVLAWRDHMTARITDVGDSLDLQDGGPDQAGLMVGA